MAKITKHHKILLLDSQKFKIAGGANKCDIGFSEVVAKDNHGNNGQPMLQLNGKMLKTLA